MQSEIETDIWDMSFCYQKSNLFIIYSLVQLPCYDLPVFFAISVHFFTLLQYVNANLKL